MKKQEWNIKIEKRIAGIALSFGILAAFLCWQQVRKERELQERIAEEVIRFHVLANSDEEEDQKLKQNVRDIVLSDMKELLQDCESAEASRRQIKGHLKELEHKVSVYVKIAGYDYPVKAELGKDCFPEKTYGDCTFPAGEYEALRIKIGSARGHNWWCMVYPGLCFTEETGAYVSEEHKTLLKHVLSEEEFDLVTRQKRIKLTWKCLEWFR